MPEKIQSRPILILMGLIFLVLIPMVSKGQDKLICVQNYCPNQLGSMIQKDLFMDCYINSMICADKKFTENSIDISKAKEIFNYYFNPISAGLTMHKTAIETSQGIKLEDMKILSKKLEAWIKVGQERMKDNLKSKELIELNQTLFEFAAEKLNFITEKATEMQAKIVVTETPNAPGPTPTSEVVPIQTIVKRKVPPSEPAPSNKFQGVSKYIMMGAGVLVILALLFIK